MKKVWAKRTTITTKRTRKSKIPPLVVSEDHRAQIPTRYRAINWFFYQKKILITFYISGDDSHRTDRESENLEPQLDDSCDESSESESELGDKFEGDDADEVDEPENGVNIVCEKENDPPFNAVASTPNSDAPFENADSERVVHVALITSNLGGMNLSDDSVSLSFIRRLATH